MKSVNASTTLIVFVLLCVRFASGTEFLQELKEARNDVIRQWEDPYEDEDPPTPVHRDAFEITEKTVPWQPPKEKDSTPPKEKDSTPPKEKEFVKAKKKTKHERKRDGDSNTVHKGNGETHSTFAIIVLAFFPAVVSVLVCGTLMVAVFSKAARPGSLEQRARHAIDDWGVLDGVGTDDVEPPLVYEDRYKTHRRIKEFDVETGKRKSSKRKKKKRGTPRGGRGTNRLRKAALKGAVRGVRGRRI